MQCQLEHIRKLRTASAIKKALVSLPPGLPAMYKAMLDRVGRVPEDLTHARTALMWLVHCPRKLTLRELAVAAVIDPESDFEEEMRLTTCSDILEICGSFVKMDHKSVIELAHFSVIEFLTSETLPGGSRNEYFIDKDRANILLLKACFNYLHSSQFASVSCDSTPTQLKNFVDNDFCLPASICWPYFAQSNPKGLVESKLVCRFLESSAFNSWSSFWDVLWESFSQINRFWAKDPKGPDVEDFVLYAPNSWILSESQKRSLTPQRHSPVYFAARFSLPCVTKILLDHGLCPNGNGDYPIFWAIRRQNIEIVGMLLSAGADVAVQLQPIGRTPLHHAVGWGNLSIIRLLIEWKADVTVKVGGETPLVLALRRFYFTEPDPELVRLLVYNKGNDAENRRNALVVAVRRGL